MKHVTIIAAFVALAVAQLLQLPPCSLQCLSQGLGAAGCRLFPSDCACRRANQVATVVDPCVKRVCPDEAQQDQVVEVYRDSCRKLGIPIDVPGGPPANNTEDVDTSTTPESPVPTRDCSDGLCEEIDIGPIEPDLVEISDEYTVDDPAEPCTAVITITSTQTLTQSSKTAPCVAPSIIPEPTSISNTWSLPTSGISVGTSSLSTPVLGISSISNTAPNNTIVPTVTTSRSATSYSSAPPEFTAAAGTMDVPAAIIGIFGLVALML